MVDAVAADADEILLEEPLEVAVLGEGEARPFCFAGVVEEEVAIFASSRRC